MSQHAVVDSVNILSAVALGVLDAGGVDVPEIEGQAFPAFKVVLVPDPGRLLPQSRSKVCASYTASRLSHRTATEA